MQCGQSCHCGDEEDSPVTHGANMADGLIYYSQSLASLWQVKMMAGAVLTWFSSVFGGHEMLVIMMVSAVCLDLVLGLVHSFTRGKFRCRVLARGVLKLPCYGIYMLLVACFNLSLKLAVGFETPLLNIFLAYLIFTDGISILTHLHNMGMPVPSLLWVIVYKGKKKIEQVTKNTMGGGDDEQQKADM